VKLTSVTLFLIGTAHGADIPLFNLTLSNANGQASTYRGVPALKMISKDGTHQAFARIPVYRSGTAPSTWKRLERRPSALRTAPGDLSESFSGNRRTRAGTRSSTSVQPTPEQMINFAPITPCSILPNPNGHGNGCVRKCRECTNHTQICGPANGRICGAW
jgi:hypothetical protein